MTTQRTERTEEPKQTGRTEVLVAEARQAAELARGLVDNVNRMHAAGYHNEIVVAGEVWIVEAKRRAPAN